jgi:hypothetical protein
MASMSKLLLRASVSILCCFTDLVFIGKLVPSPILLGSFSASEAWKLIGKFVVAEQIPLLFCYHSYHSYHSQRDG